MVNVGCVPFLIANNDPKPSVLISSANGRTVFSINEATADSNPEIPLSSDNGFNNDHQVDSIFFSLKFNIDFVAVCS